MPYKSMKRVQTGVDPLDFLELLSLATERQCSVADIARQCIREGLKVILKKEDKTGE